MELCTFSSISAKKFFLLTLYTSVTSLKVKKNVQNEKSIRNVTTTKKTGILYVLLKNVHYSKTYIIIEVALQPFGSKMEPGSKKNKKCIDFRNAFIYNKFKKKIDFFNN